MTIGWIISLARSAAMRGSLPTKYEQTNSMPGAVPDRLHDMPWPPTVARTSPPEARTSSLTRKVTSSVSVSPTRSALLPTAETTGTVESTSRVAHAVLVHVLALPRSSVRRRPVSV